MSINVERVYDGGVYVTREQSIQVGHRFRISPSEGYMGVESGYVEVTHILTGSDIQEIAGDDDTADVVSMIESYKDSMLDMCTDRDGTRYEPDYSDTLKYLDTSVWVVYTYPHSNNGVSSEGLLVFPLEEFLLHTSMF